MEDVNKDEPVTETTSSEGTEAQGDDFGYQFDDDLDSTPAPADDSTEPAGEPTGAPRGQGGDGRHSDELMTKTIHAKFRTFYVDLKESINGRFVKISEKSRGRKSTIMMDAEDVPAMIEALTDMSKHL